MGGDSVTIATKAAEVMTCDVVQDFLLGVWGLGVCLKRHLLQLGDASRLPPKEDAAAREDDGGGGWGGGFGGGGKGRL